MFATMIDKQTVKSDRNLVEWHSQMTIKRVESRKQVEENLERWRFTI